MSLFIRITMKTWPNMKIKDYKKNNIDKNFFLKDKCTTTLNNINSLFRNSPELRLKEKNLQKMMKLNEKDFNSLISGEKST